MPRNHHPNDTPIRTIGQLAAVAPRWVRLSCDTVGCGHHAAVALVPLLIRWGPAAPRHWLETRFRCPHCGRRNSSIRLPSNLGSHGPEPFPDRQQEKSPSAEAEGLSCRFMPVQEEKADGEG